MTRHNRKKPLPAPCERHENYQLLDSGHACKLERFGPVVIQRPCAQAVWSPRIPDCWEQADALFDRRGGLHWKGREHLPDAWQVTIGGLRLKLSTTDFGHLGVFPETVPIWQWIAQHIERARTHRTISFLNLFAYSGGATLAAARAGASCCHLDASRGMIEWARENAALNRLENKPVRWVTDDAIKFLRREIKRGQRYDLVLLDPPSFGRGRKGEVYKIERDLPGTLELVKHVLSENPLGVVLTTHTPGFTPTILQNLLAETFPGGHLERGEMLLCPEPPAFPLPSGAWARWTSATTP